MNDLAVKLKLNVSEEINRFRSKSNIQQIRKDFDAVWVFSGPGTINRPLKEGDKPTMEWMDRDRILYGAELIAQITAKRLRKNPTSVTKNDILAYGPFLIYNGLRIENRDLREKLQSSSGFLPNEKVCIIDEVVDKQGLFHPITNTLDQIKSFPKDLITKGLIRHRIAIVSHAEHFPRILRYLAMYKTIPTFIRVELYPLVTQNKIRKHYEEEEARKIWEYFQKGHLSWDPLPVF